ncbi:MAG TPA: high-affinity branched-chain amino acid ABC transporter ATP-binding protein LivG, partial [Thermoanaerobaculia bacterium]
LLLDEPAAGLNTGETIALMNKIREIRDRFGVAILLIEHNMELVMGICERILVLNYGKTIAQGSPAEIQSNPVVIEAYLGEPASEVSQS